MTPDSEIIESDDDRIHVEFTETMSDGTELTITGWPESAEDLDLLGPGPMEANGIEVVEEDPVYYPDDDPEDENTYPRGYTRVVLAFDDEETMRWASNRLYRKATERFEWGDASGGEDVQNFAGAFPYEVTA